MTTGWAGYAQQIDRTAVMQFRETTHDFGTIKEDGGPAEYDFTFVNGGSTPLKIESVKASCGCTTPEWSEDLVLPGDTGFIKVQYNPFNRPGPFQKSITVTSNANPNVNMLTIEGHVMPKPKTLEDEFPYQMGELRFKHKILNMGKLTTKDSVTKDFPVYNEGDRIVVFSGKILGPDHIKITFHPKILTPGKRGKMRLTYYPGKGDLGFSSDNIVIFTNEKEMPNKKFDVYATVEEFFQPINIKDMAVVPRISFDKLNHDFGKIKQGEIVNTEFIFTNTGKEDLNIRQAKTFCNCTSLNLEKDILKSGESAKIEVSFNTTDIIGNQQKSIVLFSNDPTGPTRVLTIKAKVVD